MNKKEFMNFYTNLDQTLHNLSVTIVKLNNTLKYVETKTLRESIEGKIRSMKKIQRSLGYTRDGIIKKYPDYHDDWKNRTF